MIACIEMELNMPDQAPSMVMAVFAAPAYEQVNRQLAALGLDAPDGRLYHIVCESGDGYLVYDIWESAAKLERFNQVLAEALARIGASHEAPLVYPVHKLHAA